MMNPAHSVDPKPSERIAEIGGLLADALMRLQSRKSSVFAREFGESSLHFTPDQSSDAPSCSPEASP
ncbi:hypothetical protein [Bradyrhizobium sp. URHD0069]|uniref:hypothetical protein n=1 Tax=Bradyrhizobium sp. URHD0069 TaxID=1380355 RepID=UPI0012DE4791|nr:hypothetical protein [Bradyrhizobium sp. URHD0069]